MDHRLIPNQPGLDQDSSTGEDGVQYLRTLKNAAGTPGTATPSPRGDDGALVEASPTGIERRRSLRYRCSGSAEFRAEGSDVRMWGTLTDISLHGCYIEMSTTFPVDTRVDLSLEASGIRVRLVGTVRVSYPFLGMGISFTEIEPGQQLQLEQLLFTLVGQTAPPAETEPSEDKAGKNMIAGAVEAADPKVVIEEVRRFFAENGLLSREEFLLIAKRAMRS